MGIDPNTEFSPNEKLLLRVVKDKNYTVYNSIRKFEFPIAIDFEAKDDQGNTALHISYQNKDPRMTRMLIESGANIESLDHTGNTLLCSAITNGDIDLIQFLIENKVDLNSSGTNNISPIHLALEMKNIQIAKLLISLNVDFEIQNKTKDTVLLRIVRDEIDSLLPALLKREVDLDYKDQDGKTALHLAFDKNKKEYALMLILAGANLELKDKSEDTVLLSLIKLGYVDLIPLMFEVNQEINLEEKTQEGDTAIHLAYTLDSQENVKFLIQKGANIEEVNSEGDTLLVRAVNRQDADMVLFLLQSKAKINTQTKNGDTPLHLAMREPNLEIIKYLMEYGANTKIKNYDDEKPVHILRAKKDPDTEYFFDQLKFDRNLKKSPLFCSMLQLLCENVKDTKSLKEIKKLLDYNKCPPIETITEKK
eukprot:Anaeramoba_flamelloidesa1054987_82.p1 GENE.a1054987_82~~a1054987_82.p1  ORF type:complete len:488 (+),score=107.80 a1054987_82:200-1465(+)